MCFDRKKPVLNSLPCKMLLFCILFLFTANQIAFATQDFVKVEPLIGTWEYDICVPGFFWSEVAKCVNWYEGEWEDTIPGPYNGICVNMAEPKPWQSEASIISKASAYPGGDRPVTLGGWLEMGETFEPSYCYTGPPVYKFGIEIRNAAGLFQTDKNGRTRIIAYANRRKPVKCPEGTVELPEGHPQASQGGGCYKPPVYFLHPSQSVEGCDYEGNPWLPRHRS